MNKNGKISPTHSPILRERGISNNHRFVIKHSLIYLFFTIFCCFPYIQIIPLPTDSQPYALVLGIIIILISKPTKLVRELYYLLIVMLWSIIVICLSKLNFNSIRSVLNYVSLFVIAEATYIILCKCGSLKFTWFKKIVYIWGGVALIQQFIYPSFGSVLLSRMAGSGISGRGMTSLAPEPTFYAIICALFSIICFLNYRSNQEYNKTQYIIWGQLILFSRSATMLFLSGIAYLLYRIIISIRHNPKLFIRLVFWSIIIYITTNLTIQYFEHYRFGALVQKLLANPSLFVTVDESVNERFIHAFFPIYAFFKEWGIPFGYGHFSDYMVMITNSRHFSEYIPFVKPSYTRIMSGIGSALFELGLPAILIIIVIYRCFLKLFQQNTQSLFWGILFFFILLNAMPLSNALIGYVLGNLIFYSHNLHTEDIGIEKNKIKGIHSYA